jgi:hypothetical protein
MKTFREFILECELVEGLEPLPREKMLRQTFRKSITASNLKSRHNFKTVQKPKIEKMASKIKKIKTKLRTHDPLDSRFRELENRDRGDRK